MTESLDNDKKYEFDKESCNFERNRAKSCECCYISTEESTHLRRCFMTGEYCSQQPNIQRKRKEFYSKGEISAFVVMNFSDMSDVVYKWRLHDFIESLSQYLYINEDDNRLYCSIYDKEQYAKVKKGKKVSKIHVVRSDTDLASNYIICSRVCQQMQIADLVVVDVSSQNPNVFYEFGMAVALGKLILPICYSESFYKMVIPEEIQKLRADYFQKEFLEGKDPEKEASEKEASEKNKNAWIIKELEHHIGCYPWCKDLFEYYGIRYRRKSRTREEANSSGTRYMEYEWVTNPGYGFSDVKYALFPYHEQINKKKIGQTIYEQFKENYNYAQPENNTLVVYTMEGFLNEGQAGRCIVNFYHDITSRMRQEQCFYGERVGVLVQENVIPERDRDAKSQLDLFYNVGEIIHIGLNQATFLTEEKKIRTEDFLQIPDFVKEREEEIERDEKKDPVPQKEDILRFVKGYIRNRGMLIYPNNPVYVNRMKNQLQEDILEEGKTDCKGCSCSNLTAFCLYHVMLRNLRCTNEIVVDISNNCLQSLFWLGAAHGMDVHAITVRHEKTEKERELAVEGTEKKPRNIFDVAGLWTAILHSNDTEGFYEQLASAQKGIERHTKLMSENRKFYKESLDELLSSFDTKLDEKKIQELYEREQERERLELESYYRRRFWNPMLHYNQLNIYLSQKNEIDQTTKQPRLFTSKWDFDAIAELSYYLSKRTVIGEYVVKSLQANTKDEAAEKKNFISVGDGAKPLEEKLQELIWKKIGEPSPEEKKKFKAGYNVVHKYEAKDFESRYCNGGTYKGFQLHTNENEGIFTIHSQKECTNCQSVSKKFENHVFTLVSDIKERACCQVGEKVHNEVAQLILWRENPKSKQERGLFRVALTGSSGPATFALSALFIDQEQKKKYFKTEDDERKETFLCELQAKARGKFMEIFLIKLHDMLEGMEMTEEPEREEEPEKQNPKPLGERQKKCYVYLVEYAVSLYLSTVLYRYFLPFLSEQDIKRIHNGMKTFVNSMKAAGASPFAENYSDKGNSEFRTSVSNENIRDIVQKIPEILLEVLNSFRGLEAFYLVEVSHDAEAVQIAPQNEKAVSDDKKETDEEHSKNEDEGFFSDIDTRKVQGIKLLDQPGISSVNCFFVPKK